jgi:hypothetical protein
MDVKSGDQHSGSPQEQLIPAGCLCGWPRSGARSCTNLTKCPRMGDHTLGRSFRTETKTELRKAEDCVVIIDTTSYAGPTSLVWMNI